MVVQDRGRSSPPYSSPTDTFALSGDTGRRLQEPNGDSVSDDISPRASTPTSRGRTLAKDIKAVKAELKRLSEATAMAV